MKMGDIIKDLRTSRKITQKELSLLAAIPFATINRLEKGKANPTVRTLEKILNVFGYKLSVKRKKIEN